MQEKLENGFLLDDTCNAIDVANILKYFFRELPEPLLPPGNFQESILRCLLCKGFADRKVCAIQMVCLLLPTVNLSTLAYFTQFLHFVSLHSATNKMPVKNLAIILAPGLMPILENIGQRLNSHVQVIEILIENAHEVGIVPDNLLCRMPNCTLSETICDPHDCTNVSSSTRRSMRLSLHEVPQTEIKKKKKRRSGSLTSKCSLFPFEFSLNEPRFPAQECSMESGRSLVPSDQPRTWTTRSTTTPRYCRRRV